MSLGFYSIGWTKKAVKDKKKLKSLGYKNCDGHFSLSYDNF